MSPGQVVMGGDSCYRGHGFKSQHRILDGHFSHFTEKNCFQEDRNKRKEALFKLQKNVAFASAATPGFDQISKNSDYFFSKRKEIKFALNRQ